MPTMTDGLTLYQELDDECHEADTLNRQSVTLGRKAAQTECDYRCLLSERLLRERAENSTPVSIIGDVVRGQHDVAALKVKRDCAEVEYDACREAVLLSKKRIDILREQINREWGRSCNQM